MRNNNSVKAYSAAVLFSILVAFSFMGVKTCLETTTPVYVLAHRYNCAAICLLALMAVRIIKLDIRGKKKKNLYLTAGFYLGFMALQTIGLVFSTSIESAIIFAMIPIIAKMLATVILKEHSTLKQNAFMGLSVAALIVMIVMGATQITAHLGGIVILLVSSACMAASNVYMRYVRTEYKPAEITAMIVIGGFLVFNVAALVNGIVNGTLNQYFTAVKNPSFVIAAFYLGAFCILASAQLMAYMLANMEAVKATVFGNLSTALSIIIGVIVLKEALLPYHILCTVLIVAGVLGVSFAAKPGLPLNEGGEKND